MKTLESVKKQTFPLYEHIIIDANSTDGSKETILKYEKENPHLTFWSSEPDKGIYDGMNKGIKNTDNYFERVKQRANRTNYRYYFFDYLYFKGEVWGKKIGRMSGFILLFWYWWWVVVLPGNFLLINSVPEWSSLHLGYLGAMFLLICVFILARYRKARVQALLNRYRRSKHISAVQAYFLFLLPFVLFFLETWLFDEWGWTDCVRWNK